VASVTSATRAPGKYTVKWDGKDLHGKPVTAGSYFVNIEAAREHGTYQMMRQEVDFSGTPKTVALGGGTEIASATLEYRKIQ
jgi:thiamine biosynthesis lipoprotein